MKRPRWKSWALLVTVRTVVICAVMIGTLPQEEWGAGILCVFFGGAAVILATAVLATAVADYRREHRREAWAARRACRHCGYYLRGLRIRGVRYSGTCPECGMPFS